MEPMPPFVQENHAFLNIQGQGSMPTTRSLIPVAAHTQVIARINAWAPFRRAKSLGCFYKVYQVCDPNTVHWLLRKGYTWVWGAGRWREGDDAQESRLFFGGGERKRIKRARVALVPTAVCSLYTEGAILAYLSNLFPG